MRNKEGINAWLLASGLKRRYVCIVVYILVIFKTLKVDSISASV